MSLYERLSQKRTLSIAVSTLHRNPLVCMVLKDPRSKNSLLKQPAHAQENQQ
jgi:hypothetical protein